MKTIFKLIFFISAIQFASSIIDQNFSWRYYDNATNITALNLRSDATFDDNVLMVIPKHSAVEMISRNGRWTQIIFDEMPGFVHSDYLTYDVLTPSMIIMLLWIILHSIGATYLTYIRRSGIIATSSAFFKHLISLSTAIRFLITFFRRISFNQCEKNNEVITYRHSVS